VPGEAGGAVLGFGDKHKLAVARLPEVLRIQHLDAQTIENSVEDFLIIIIICFTQWGKAREEGEREGKKWNSS
jgi:hypothetical protein